ncbi:MAG: signal peptide peptidase SppA [Flavobacteriales bacterium]|nr:signal peptide peptidase SppA [Flavobacteriales bacterium]|tara:strand:- start:5906 stop:7705 length:1800 start_codon:yes stop_codon:yes gene_type:complete
MNKLEKINKRKKKYSFLKNILSSVIGNIIAVTIIFLMILFTIIFSLSSNQKDTTSDIKNNCVVKIKFNYPIYDSSNSELNNLDISQVSTVNFEENLNLFKILSAIKLASNNKKVNGILLELDEFQGPSGWATLKEIRDALLEFKESGKFIWSYSKYLSQSAYYIASVSDSIIIYPNTGVDFKGLSITSIFLTETLDKMGIKPEVIKSGKYKSAVEPFLLKEMSDENKEQSLALLNNAWSQVINDISKSRKISTSELEKIADKSIDNWIIPKTSKLIDDQKYPQDFLKMLNKKNSSVNEKISFISLNEILNTKIKESKKHKIGIIYAEGEIGDNENSPINPKKHCEIIKQLKDDNEIKAVVLRINSPGGSALASDIILNELNQLKKIKPLVISMGDVAASGGYYIASNANKIFASENTITGSIGVFGLFFTMEDLLKNKMNLHFDEINSNKFSNFGNPYKALNKDEKNMLANLIDRTYGSFLNRVSEGRSIPVKKVEEIAQGRVWNGKDAKINGLVDQIGNLNDAINFAANILEIESYQIVEYPKEKNLIEFIIEEFQTNYKNQQDISLFIEDLKNHNIKKIISNKLGVQARLPINIHIN